MKKLKKINIRILLIFLLIAPVFAFAHYLIFPQQTRSILIDFSNFKKDSRFYFNRNTPQKRMEELKLTIQQAPFA
ncbi:MAG: hypothetical protein ACHQD7_04495 [Chitinophagales bacterium]